jgi:hypothetical protein
MLSVAYLIVMLSVTMPSVVMLNVVMLGAVAPPKIWGQCYQTFFTAVSYEFLQ